MPINPKYAELANSGGGSSIDKYDSVRFENVGDGVVGVILDFTDPYTMPNKFYQEGQSEDKKTVTQVKVNLETKDGPRSLFIQKKGQFQALAEALIEADLSDFIVGHTFGMKWTGLGKANAHGSRPHMFEAKFVKPSE